MENNEPKPGYLGPNLEGHKEPVPEMAWEQIEAGLNKRKRRGFIFWLWGGMGILLIGLGIWFSQTRLVEPTQTVLHPPTEENRQAKAIESEALSQEKLVDAEKKLKSQVEPTNEKQETIARTVPSNEPEVKGLHQPDKMTPEPTRKATHHRNQRKQQAQSHSKENGLANASVSVVEPIVLSSGKKKQVIKTNSEKVKQTEPETPTTYVAISPEKAPEALAIEKQLKAESVKQENQIIEKEAAHTEIAGTEKPGSEKKIEPSNPGNKTNGQEEPKEKQAISEPVLPSVSQLQSNSNEAVASVSKVDSARKTSATDSIQKKEEPVDEAKSQIKKPTPAPMLKWQRQDFWMFSINAGVMQQNGRLEQDYFNNQGRPLVSTSSAQVSLAPSIRLAFSRMWQVTELFWIGLEASANGIFQKTQANLNPSEESPIRYRYGADSLTFFAETDYRNQEQTYTRKTWIAGLFPKIRWKPGPSPVGLQARIGLASFTRWDGVNKSLSNPSGSFELGYTNTEFGLWMPLKEKAQITLDFNHIKWSQQSLPIPVKNQGKNWIISVGFGWKW